MSVDLVIRGGRVFGHDGAVDLAIQGGRIVQIGGAISDAGRELDARGMPFVITDAEIDRVVEVLAGAISQAVADAQAATA